MIELSYEEIMLILTAFRNAYGSGYADNPIVAQLQAKLSIWLEVKAKKKVD